MSARSQKQFPVASFETKKERERFYLLPGMGGSSARRKHKKILQWSIVAGVLVSIALAIAMYYLNATAK